LVQTYVAGLGTKAILCRHWAKGGAGAEDLARAVVETVEAGGARFSPLYPDSLSLFEKIQTVARRIYRANAVTADKAVLGQLARWQKAGFGHLPVCMAKTQYSFTTDPTRLGAPSGFEVRVREVRLAAGAGFVVAICGEILTMPGLPRRPAAESIGLDEEGRVTGLF
jgi:formate--tetrahydrofolate ligase